MAGTNSAAPIPPITRDKYKIIIEFEKKNINMDNDNALSPIIIIFRLPYWSAHLPAIGDIMNCAPANIAIINPAAIPPSPIDSKYCGNIGMIIPKLPMAINILTIKIYIFLRCSGCTLSPLENTFFKCTW